MTEAVRAAAGSDASGVAGALHDAFASFLEAAPPEDDVAFLVIAKDRV